VINGNTVKGMDPTTTRLTARASQDGHILPGRSSDAAAVSASTTGPKPISRRMKSTPRKSKQNVQLLGRVNRSMRSGTPSMIATTAATT
jgi:hypothetical protein